MTIKVNSIMTSEITPKELSDVPKDVMDKVYVKWSNALEVATVNNWQDCGLWNGCAMCDWMGSGCTTCPLVADRWCRRIDRTSRIHIVYHNNIDEWRADIIKFLKYIKPYCSRDIDNWCTDTIKFLEYVKPYRAGDIDR